MVRGIREALPPNPIALPVCVVPEGSPKWVTVELLAQTMDVWQPYYAEPLTPLDALEMLLSVGRLMRVLSSKENDSHR